jgi:hypothetical protein
LTHIVLLGDSILDNVAYTKGGPEVIAQVRELIPNGWSATLLAVDGSTTEEVPTQVLRLPTGATHLILSVGGNDAIMNSDVLLEKFASVESALAKLTEVSSRFETKYRRAISACRQTSLPLTVCTIYNGNFDDPVYQRLASTALMVFNDAILRVAFEHGLSVIDLRFVCSSPDDYANPIEPSSKGGAKIAQCIVSSVRQSVEHVSRVMIG